MKWGATIDVGMTGIREEACPYCKHEGERESREFVGRRNVDCDRRSLSGS